MTWDLVGRRVARLHEHIVQVLHGLAVHRVGISLASIRKDVEEGSAGYGDAVNNSVVPELTGLDEAAKDEGRRRPDVRGALGSLFPESPESAPPVPVRRLLSAVLQLVAVVLGAVLLLERIPGLPSWDTIYNDDKWEFLRQAFQQPWHVFIPYGGYYQLLPRVIVQFAQYLPLAQASRLLAVCGALIASGCGLFIFHASAGHVRAMPLRAVLGAAVVLMPIAVIEIADSTVNAPWYLLLATFWALLWRPRTRMGMAAAALVAFAATSSEIVCVLFAPLVAARLFVLRRPREHAVTAGWLAGCLVQVPAVLSSFHSGQSRVGQLGSLGHSLAFYAHEVVLPAPGWHLAWWLQSFAGKNGATAIVAILLVAAVGAILGTQPSSRPFVVTALLTGFAFCLFETTVNGHVASLPLWKFGQEPGSRYTVLPIFLIQAVVIVGIDYLVRQRGGLRRPGTASLLPAIAVFTLVAVLGGSWVADFRYAAFRSYGARNWGPIAADWQHDCAHSRSGAISERFRNIPQTLPCAHIRS